MSLAISIRQPWAWLILHAGKDIENRTWRTLFRGRVLIHAAKLMTLDDYAPAEQAARWLCPKVHLPGRAGLQFGGIVGEAEIVDCVAESESPWFSGPWGFVLRNVKPLPFQPCRGSLGFFTFNEQRTS